MADDDQPLEPFWQRGLVAARAALRCRARSKRTKLRCRAPALTGWQVCRFHGARGGAPCGKANGAFRHGRRTKAVVEARQAVKRRWKENRAQLKAIADRLTAGAAAEFPVANLTRPRKPQTG